MAYTRLSQTTEANGEELIGVGVEFDRIRRITGYLVGTLDRFNNAKRAEERDRVKHFAVGAAAMSCGCHEREKEIEPCR